MHKQHFYFCFVFAKKKLKTHKKIHKTPPHRSTSSTGPSCWHWCTPPTAPASTRGGPTAACACTTLPRWVVGSLKFLKPLKSSPLCVYDVAQTVGHHNLFHTLPPHQGHGLQQCSAPCHASCLVCHVGPCPLTTVHPAAPCSRPAGVPPRQVPVCRGQGCQGGGTRVGELMSRVLRAFLAKLKAQRRGQ